MVGAPAVPHLTGGPLTPNVAVPLPVVAACLSKSTKDLPAVAVGMVKAQAVDAVKVAVWTVPLVNTKVLEVTTVPITTTDST